MTNEEKFNIALRFLKMIPDECNPKIGGSCALWRKGLKDNFDDVDIIVDYLPSSDFLSHSVVAVEIPLKHPKRLNDTIEYKYKGVHIDIHESIMPRRGDGILEDVENILYAQKLLKRFFKVVYDEEVDKWKY